LFLFFVVNPQAPVCAQNAPTNAVPVAPPPLPAPAPQITLPDLPAPVPPANRLSLRQAVQSGLHDNPQITSARYAVLSAHENYNSQKSPINPTISYAALNNSVAPADFVTGFALRSNYSAYVTIETNGAIRYRTAQAREQYHQAQFDAATTGLSLKLSIIAAYVGLQVANRALEVELKVYDNMRQLSDLTRKRFEAGAGLDADARRANIAAIQELQNVIADVANVSAARATLNQQLGHLQNTPVDAAQPLVYRPIPVRDLAELTQLAEQRRPEILSAQANLRSLRAVPGLERSALYPDLVVARDFGRDSPVELGLSVPLDLGGIHGAIQKAKADVKTQEAQVELARQSVDMDVKSAYINLIEAQKQVDTYVSGGILPQSEVLLNQIRQGYTLGANTILDVITAENTYRSVETAYYSAVGAYVQAAYVLKHAIGDLPDNMPDMLLTSIGLADLTTSPVGSSSITSTPTTSGPIPSAPTISAPATASPTTSKGMNTP
jgi:outer membrane protein TolC